MAPHSTGCVQVAHGEFDGMTNLESGHGVVRGNVRAAMTMQTRSSA